MIDALKPHFERATGHTLTIKYVLTPQVSLQAEAGEAFDVAITAPGYIAALTKSKLVAGGASSLMRAPIPSPLRPSPRP